MKNILIFIAGCMLFSCMVSCENETKNMIAGGDFKYWIDDSDRVSYFYFDMAGRWTIYEKYKGLKKYNGEDYHLHEYWCLIGDSISNVNGRSCLLIMVIPDKMLLRG